MQKQIRYRILKFDIVCLDCSKSKKKIKRKDKRREKKKERKDAKLREVYSEIKTDSLCTFDRVRFEQVIFAIIMMPLINTQL